MILAKTLCAGTFAEMLKYFDYVDIEIDVGQSYFYFHLFYCVKFLISMSKILPHFLILMS